MIQLYSENTIVSLASSVFALLSAVPDLKNYIPFVGCCKPHIKVSGSELSNVEQE